jgi:tRNA(fMet)-specific endonuclease VapC
MIILPDTNAWIRFLNPGDNQVKERFLSADRSKIRICSVVKAELYFGAMKSSRSIENLEILDTLFVDLVSLPFDDAAARIYGEIRSALAHAGTPIGPNDLMIASIALVHAAELVTHNTKEFSRVPGLRFDDWELKANGV